MKLYGRNYIVALRARTVRANIMDDRTLANTVCGQEVYPKVPDRDSGGGQII